MRTLLFAAALLLLAAPGCSETPRGRLHGKITYRGKPVRAMIIFFAEDNSTHLADIGADGGYSVDGVPRGRVRAAVQMEQPRPPSRPAPAGAVSKNSSPDPGDPSGAARGRAVRQGPEIPGKYGDPATSELAFELTGAEQEFSADLK